MSKTKQILYLAVALALFLSLAACAVGTQEEENTLLEYPGVSWAATPEEVIQAMGFPAGEVLTETVEDGYNLGMENWDCFGQEAQRIVFHFEADEAGRDRLHAIEITYPEDGAWTPSGRPWRPNTARASPHTPLPISCRQQRQMRIRKRKTLW